MCYRTLAAVLAALALASCGEPPADEAPEAQEQAARAAAGSDEAALDALADSWESAYNAHDAEAVVALYAEEAGVWPANGGGFEGRDEIRGWLTDAFEADPTVRITPGESHVAGDMAMSIGRYALTMSPEGAGEVAASGTYMNALERIDGQWRLVASVTNYDAPPPEGMEWNSLPEGEPPEEDDTFAELVSGYEAAWAAGDAAAVAALHTEDARVAYSDGPILEGRAAVEAALEERMVPGTSLRIHPVSSEALGDGFTGQGGWYELVDAQGNAVQTGAWMNLVEVQDDGTARIHWTITNARPLGA